MWECELSKGDDWYVRIFLFSWVHWWARREREKYIHAEVSDLCSIICSWGGAACDMRNEGFASNTWERSLLHAGHNHPRFYMPGQQRGVKFGQELRNKDFLAVGLNFLARRKLWDVTLLMEASSVSYPHAFNWLSWHLSRGHRFLQGVILNTCQEELPCTQSHVSRRCWSADSGAVSPDPHDANFKTCKYW